MKVQVTVEMELNNLPDDTARELARELIEARGLDVARVAIVKTADRAKTFIPKRGKPGSVITDHNGIALTVWSEAEAGSVWATRRDNPDGLYYKVGLRGGWAEAYHGNGKRHTPQNGMACCERQAVA